MFKFKKFAAAALIITIGFIAGCTAAQSPMIKYQGKEQEARLVSEQLEDIVEAENPGMDIDIVMTVNEDNGE